MLEQTIFYSIRKEIKAIHHNEISGEIYVSKQPFFQMLLHTHIAFLNTIRANTAVINQLCAAMLKEKVVFPFHCFARDTNPTSSDTEVLRADQ